MFILRPDFGAGLTTRRWLVLVAMSLIAAVVALLQLTSAALFPAAKTDELAGVATGMALMTAAVRLNQRRIRQAQEPR